MIETTTRTLHDLREFNARTRLAPAPHAPTAAHPTLAPRVNHGRWVVDCPSCSSALLGNPHDPRFWCVECLNVEHGGAWLDVEWPDAALRGAAEAELEKRPRREHRNWTPTREDVAALIGENIEHGVD